MQLPLIGVGSLLLLFAVWMLGPRLAKWQPPASHTSSADSAARPRAGDDGIDPDALRIKSWHAVEGLQGELAQFETVFWEPDDTASLRNWLSQDQRLPGARVLEVGTGTGLLGLLCAQRGARQVVATDINPQAVANARYNAELLGCASQMHIRLVPPSNPAPFAVIEDQERFDLIISNPPWEDAAVHEVAAYALYDPGFALLDGLVQHSGGYLTPQGKLLLAYGAKTPIVRILSTAPAAGWQVEVEDERDLEDLPEVFVPGILLVLSPSPAK